MSAAASLRRAALALTLSAVVACGTTVPQQATLGGTGQPGAGAAPGEAGDGLTLPEDGLAPEAAVGEPDGGGASGGGDSGPGAEVPVPDGSSAGPSGGTTAGAADAPDAQGAAPAPGAADTRPLRVGLLYVNNDAAASAGVDNGNSFGPRRALEALVKATNAEGGLAGRQLQPTYAEIRSSSSSYAADLQAACSRFVEDAKTPLVLSFLGLTSDQFNACLGSAGVAHVNGSYGLGDITSLRAHATTVSIEALSVDRRSKAALERLAAAGFLTRASRIGVVVEDCPFNTRGYERTFLPTAKRLGLNVVDTQSVRCFGGLNDLGGQASDAQSAVLRFASQGVDRVMFVSSLEANVLLVFTNAAESQGYRPGYGLTSLALANVLKDNVPTAQLVNAKGVGWLPVLDDTAPTLTPTAAAQACVKKVRAQGVVPTSRADHFTVFSQCDAFGLAEAALERSRGATSPAAWSAALDAVGTSLLGAATLEGRTDFRDGRREGPAVGRVFGWDRGCSCFRYAGGTFPV